MSIMMVGCGDADVSRTEDGSSAVLADPRATMTEILAEPDRLQRVGQLVSVLQALPADQVGSLEEVLADNDIFFRPLERILLLTAWAKVDPRAAMKWAYRREVGKNTRDPMLLEAIGAWARRDPHALVEEYDIVNGLRTDLAGGVVVLAEGWFESSQPGLEEYIRRMPDSADRVSAIGALISLKVNQEGAHAVKEWAEALPGINPYKKSVYSRVAGELARVDPQAAVEWCEEVCNTDLGNGMTRMISVYWAGKDGGAADAMNWLLTLPPGVNNRGDIRAAYRQFVLNDADGAADWIESTTIEQRGERRLEGPIEAYINSLSSRRKDPLRAIKWVDFVPEERKRGTLLMILKRWSRRDADAAEAWIAQSSLSEDIRAEALKQSAPKFRR